MKILESRPHRYDWGINLLTGGHASRIKDDIVANYIRPDMVVLDVGCGTGSLAIKAAKAGARLTGLDISESMLAVAREQIKKNRLENEVVLNHAGVVEIDALFEENSFDLITSTLVISELYGEEREWALRELYRILKSDGKLLIVGEVKPKHPLKRAFRVDKVSIAILISVIKSYLSEKLLIERNPTFAKMNLRKDDLKEKAKKFLLQLISSNIEAEIVNSCGRCGGGTLPKVEIDSFSLKISRQFLLNKNINPEKLFQELHKCKKPIISILKEKNIFFDILTINENDFSYIATEISKAIN